MFVEVKNIDNNIEILSIHHIVKIMEDHRGCRVNMSDGSYIRTNESADDIWQKIGEEE